jgi:hypothetical protein
MLENDVLGNETETIETPVVPSKGQPETITISKAEYERMARERDEARQSEKFWADRARGGKTPEPEVEEEEESIETSDLVPARVSGKSDVDEAIFSDPDKWLDAISKGPKAIEALVKKQGFVSAEEAAVIAAKVARRTVDVERSKITTDNKLMSAYPELANSKSELFKATAQEYQELIEFDPSAKKSPATLFAAAKAAKAKLAATKPARGAEDDEYGSGYDRAESDRRSRVAAQDGSRGGRGSRGEEPDDTLGPQAKAIARMMGVTDEEFIAERRKTDAARRRR